MFALSDVPRPPLTDEQRIAWLRLIRSDNVGPVTFRELINHFGGAEAALEALPALSRRGGRLGKIRIASVGDVEAELRTARRLEAELVAAGEAGYPPWLSAIDAPPPLIYVKGRHELAERPIVAIVGARNGSAAGRKLTRMIANELGRAGIVIVSGLARGIDAAAHEAALERGTIAVLAGGIDIVYPPEHGELHAAIADKGLIITENPPGFQPRGQDFPRRNRIISGASAGVVVVEAAKRSGSLITARFALEQGREVFAVPGHPLDPRAAGTNALLKQGATIAAEANDILDVLSPILETGAPPKSPDRLREDYPQEVGGNDDSEQQEIAPSDRERVLAVLGPAPIEINELCRATGLSIRQTRVALLELDLAGRLERHNNQLVALAV